MLLQHPMDDRDNEMASPSDQVSRISRLSQSLVGVLGEDLIGLANAASTMRVHAQLVTAEAEVLVEELLQRDLQPSTPLPRPIRQNTSAVDCTTRRNS